jgi:WhiB family transcriptional regulator, redox-sensing transcriptional regulator
MTIAVHRPARPVTSLQGESGLLEDLPRLPSGTMLDLAVLNNAACGERPELFHPEPGDVNAERAAKRLCGRCPVQWECLKMALATNDQHAIMGGTTPAERTRLRSSYQVSRWRAQSREQIQADEALAESFRQARAARSRLFQDASAAVRAHELACQVGVWRAALALGLNKSDDLVEVLEHWGLPPVPRLKQHSRIADDREATNAAFELVNEIGWYKAGRQLRATQAALRAAFATWGLGEPAGKPWQEAREFLRDRTTAEDALRLAIDVGVEKAAEQLETTKRTLYRAWDRWGLGRPTDRAEGAEAANARRAAHSWGRRVSPDHPWMRAAKVQVAARSARASKAVPPAA